MSKKTETETKTETKTAEELHAEGEKQAEALGLNNSVGALLEQARKADTRADVNRMTNSNPNPNTLVNIVQQLEPTDEDVKEVKEDPISEAERERRTKLDVSDPLYINPSLGHKKGK